MSLWPRGSLLHRIADMYLAAVKDQSGPGWRPKNLWKLLAVQTFANQVVFFDFLPVHHQFTRPFVSSVARKQRVLLLAASERSPAFLPENSLPNVHVVCSTGSHNLRFVKARTFATPLSYLPRDRVPAGARSIHIFHSLVSMHAVYKDAAFDGYTDFFACGPHHVREAASIAALRGWGDYTVHAVGYPKVDQLAAAYRVSPPRPRGARPTILFAPSWHAENLLRTHGVALANALLNGGYDVIIRPHPRSYEFELDAIAGLEAIEREYPSRLTVERAGADMSSLIRADVMISDWSGVAYEFAFGTERPVLFVNSPRKIGSSAWDQHNCPAMEDVLREKVGILVGSYQEVEQGLDRLFSISSQEWRSRIEIARSEHLFNFGCSADVGGEILLRLAKGLSAPRLLSGSKLPHKPS